MTWFILIIILLVIVLLIYLGTRGASTNRFVASADHYHWIVRSLAALLAVSALLATAIGTWRGSGEDFYVIPFKVTIPSKAPRALPETKDYKTLDLGPAKLIGTVIVARREGEHFIPLTGESRTCDWQPDAPRNLDFSGSWQGASYTVTMNLNRFIRYGDAAVHSEGGISIQTKGWGWSSSSGGGSIILEKLSMQDFSNGRGTLQRSALSLVPTDDGGDLCLLMHLSRADADDPLTQAPGIDWLKKQPVTHLRSMNVSSHTGTRHDPDVPPGIRMFAYVGPSAFLLLLAAIAGSVCFRYGWRGPAFAGLIAAMVVYAGLLDALVLHRRASVMMDSSQPESNRILAMSAMPGTFFHAKRATFLIDEAAREGKIPADVVKGER